jgi:hypothetical protein
LKKQRKQPKFTGCKRVKDDESTEDIETDEPQLKHREKQKDERDELLEMFNNLLSDVGTNTTLLKPVFTTAIHKILMQHFEESAIPTIAMFTNRYKDTIDEAWIRTAFSYINRLDLRQYLWATYPEPLISLIPCCCNKIFHDAVIKSDLHMAKFIYGITPPNLIDQNSNMCNAKTDEMKDYLCSLDCQTPLKISIHGPGSLNNIPKCVRKLRLVTLSSSYTGDYDLRSYDKLTHLEMAGYVQSTQKLYVPTTLTYLFLDEQAKPYPVLNNCHNLETFIMAGNNFVEITITQPTDLTFIPNVIPRLKLVNDGYRGDLDLRHLTKLTELDITGDVQPSQTVYGPASLIRLLLLGQAPDYLHPSKTSRGTIIFPASINNN